MGFGLVQPQKSVRHAEVCQAEAESIRHRLMRSLRQRLPHRPCETTDLITDQKAQSTH